MKTLTDHVATFLYLACKMADKDVHELERLPKLVEETLEQVAPQIEAIVKDSTEWNDMHCLGYGATFLTAFDS